MNFRVPNLNAPVNDTPEPVCCPTCWRPLPWWLTPEGMERAKRLEREIDELCAQMKKDPTLTPF